MMSRKVTIALCMCLLFVNCVIDDSMAISINTRAEDCLKSCHERFSWCERRSVSMWDKYRSCVIPDRTCKQSCYQSIFELK